jgi:hypothetical protein
VGQQGARLAVDTQAAQQVAGGVVGDLAGEVGSQVRLSQDVDQKFAQLIRPPGKRFRPLEPGRVILEELELGAGIVLLGDDPGSGAERKYGTCSIRTDGGLRWQLLQRGADVDGWESN